MFVPYTLNISSFSLPYIYLPDEPKFFQGDYCCRHNITPVTSPTTTIQKSYSPNVIVSNTRAMPNPRQDVLQFLPLLTGAPKRHST